MSSSHPLLLPSPPLLCLSLLSQDMVPPCFWLPKLEVWCHPWSFSLPSFHLSSAPRPQWFYLLNIIPYSSHPELSILRTLHGVVNLRYKLRVCALSLPPSAKLTPAFLQISAHSHLDPSASRVTPWKRPHRALYFFCGIWVAIWMLFVDPLNCELVKVGILAVLFSAEFLVWAQHLANGSFSVSTERKCAWVYPVFFISLPLHLALCSGLLFTYYFSSNPFSV